MAESFERRAASWSFGPIIRHPVVSILTAAGLLLSGLMELLEESVANFDSVIDAHHGIMLLGFVGVLRGIAELVEGLERVEEHRSRAGAAEAAD